MRVQEHNIEQTLWKVVYYRPIEEFRRRIRLASEAGNRGQEPLRKVDPRLPVETWQPCQDVIAQCQREWFVATGIARPRCLPEAARCTAGKLST